MYPACMMTWTLCHTHSPTFVSYHLTQENTSFDAQQECERAENKRRKYTDSQGHLGQKEVHHHSLANKWSRSSYLIDLNTLKHFNEELLVNEGHPGMFVWGKIAKFHSVVFINSNAVKYISHHLMLFESMTLAVGYCNKILKLYFEQQCSTVFIILRQCSTSLLALTPTKTADYGRCVKKITNPIDWNTACNDILSTWIVNFLILNYFSTLKRQMLLKFTFNMFKESKTFWNRMTCQFHVCWWPCDVSSQDIIRYDIDLAPVSLMIFRSNSKLDQNLKCSGLKYTLLIITKFCTHHGSGTLVMCANFQCDHLSMF